jgi:hypothetical protein
MRRSSQFLFTLLLFVALSCVTSVTHGEEGKSDPGAISLLKRVEDVRLQSKPFRLRGTFRRQYAVEPKTEEPIDVAYADGKYRVRSHGKRPSAVTFDGAQILCFDGLQLTVHTTLDLLNLEDKLAFDPRILGLTPTTGPDGNFAGALPLDQDFITTSKGKESIHGTQVENISMRGNYGLELQFWIDPLNVNHVHKHVLVRHNPEPLHGFSLKSITESEFWPGAENEWIPRKIKITAFRNDDDKNAFYEGILEFRKPLKSPHFSPYAWTARGMGLRVGPPIFDGRDKTQHSHWEGEELVPALKFRAMR